MYIDQWHTIAMVCNMAYNCLRDVYAVSQPVCQIGLAVQRG